jgi:hypothetical protein
MYSARPTNLRCACAPFWAAALVLLSGPAGAADYFEVRIGDALVARIRCRGDVATLQERGARVYGRLTEIISYEPCDPSNVHVKVDNGVPAIYVGSHLLMRVYPPDAAPNNCTPRQLAEKWKANVAKWLPQAPSLAARPGKPGESTGPTFVGPKIGDAGRVDLPPEAHTGLIVDATGLGARRDISPRILDPEGQEVWGTVECSAAWAISYGIAAWGNGMEQAVQSVRAGSNPLVVRAQQVLGPVNSIFQISAEDVARVVEANAVGHFLENCNVVIAQ